MKRQGKRLPATVARSKRYGAGNQASYEVSERVERQANKARVANARPRLAKPAAPNDAMNSGTMGGRLGARGLGSGSRRKR